VKLSALREEIRLALQKFDFQNGAKIESLSTRLAPIRAQIDTGEGSLTELTKQIEQKQAFLTRPRSELVAELQHGISERYAQQRRSVAEDISTLQAQLDEILSDAVTLELGRIKNAAEERLANLIASKVVATATTDSDGRFSLPAPNGGTCVLYAETKTASGQQIIWIETLKVSPHGKTQVKLSNSTALTDVSLADHLIGVLN